MRKTKFLSLLLTVVMVLSSMTAIFAASEGEDIVIIHVNDTHCAYEGYEKVATLAKEADLLVDAGDAIQGGTIGTLSKGSYIVDIMNELKFDVAVPGNHEFDYGMDNFLNIANKQATFPYVCCNFTELATGNPVLDAYKIFEIKGKKVAIVGICTPETFTKSTPTFFQNEKGEYIYSFCEGGEGKDLYAAVQKAVDAARKAGADYVVALAHLGVDPSSEPWTSKNVIANTTGIDALIDGHSHSVVSENVKNKDGKDVYLQQTGTKLKNAGKLVIKADGTVSGENVELGENVKADEGVLAFIGGVVDRFKALAETVVAKTKVKLTIKNPDGSRAVRNKETNLGDLCADAYRTQLEADVAIVNGGGVRADIAAGDITYDNIISVHPFGNMACLVEVTGQQILDALEHGARSNPNESGGFLQVSGLTYTINKWIPSPVKVNDKEEFVSVDGTRRVSDVKVGGVAINPAKTYKLASHDYMLKSCGDGYAMFGTKNINILRDGVLVDNQVLINYIIDTLGGVVGEEYAEAQGRIKIVTFNDVKDDDYFNAAVSWAFDKGVTTGKGGGKFGPDDKCTRAQMVTLMWNAAGKPEPTTEVTFSDVAKDAWYAKAVAWAVENGITQGTSADKFSPDATVSRAQAVQFLFNEAGKPAQTKAPVFNDLATNAWYKDAVVWATEKKITSGTGATTFSPDKACLRAQIVQFIYNANKAD